MDPCASGSRPLIKNLDLYLLGKLRKEQPGDATEVERNATRSVLRALVYLARESRGLFQSFKVVSTRPRSWTFKRQTWLKHPQNSRSPFAKFLQTKFVSCPTEMPVVEVHEPKKPG